MKPYLRTPLNLDEQPSRYNHRSHRDREVIERAILRTLAYADIFDFPLTDNEIHRYLAGVSAPLSAVQSVLDDRQFRTKHLGAVDGCFTLPGRQVLVETRRQRSLLAASLWPKAIHYGRKMAGLPFVRMVAITGALAVDNVEYGADLDYLIITEAGRLWLCRAVVILLVRWAALKGDRVCPNYFLSDRALVYPHRNWYSAHEMTQMVPIAGLETYGRIRRLNRWTQDFLPNAAGPPEQRFTSTRDPAKTAPRRLAEAVLRTAPAGWLERWEMGRKVQKFSTQSQAAAEASFCADWCKGHFDQHEGRTIAAYTSRLKALGIEDRNRHE